MGSIVRTFLIASACMLGACQSGPIETTAPAPPQQQVVLTSPGPLAAKHGAVACIDCHANDTSPVVVADKCLACHRPLAQRIAAGKGFHASAVVRGKKCETCHLDHRGTGADIMGWKS